MTDWIAEARARCATPADAEFIAAARTDLPRALDALGRVRALLKHDGPVHHSEIRAALDGDA